MNDTEMTKNYSQHDELQGKESADQKNFFFLNYLKPFLFLLGIYALIINQAKRNKNQISLPGNNPIIVNSKPVHKEPRINKEEWQYQNTSFLLSK